MGPPLGSGYHRFRGHNPHKEKSRLAAGPSCSRFVQIELAIPVLLATLALLALALPVRILLLLAGLLTTTLLLTGLLAGILILLVLVGHQKVSLVGRQ